MADSTDASPSVLSDAYARQREQVNEARSTLAEAVHTLRAELAANREQLASERTQMGGAREHILSLQAEVAKLEAEITRLAAYTATVEQEARDTHAAYASLHSDLVALRNSKLIRWSAPLRVAAQRTRARRG